MKIFEFHKILTENWNTVNVVTVWSRNVITCTHLKQHGQVNDVKGDKMNIYNDLEKAMKSRVFVSNRPTLVVKVKGTDCANWEYNVV